MNELIDKIIKKLKPLDSKDEETEFYQNQVLPLIEELKKLRGNRRIKKVKRLKWQK